MYLIFDPYSNKKTDKKSFVNDKNKKNEISLLIDSLLDYRYLQSRFRSKVKKNKNILDTYII